MNVKPLVVNLIKHIKKLYVMVDSFFHIGSRNKLQDGLCYILQISQIARLYIKHLQLIVLMILIL